MHLRKLNIQLIYKHIQLRIYYKINRRLKMESAPETRASASAGADSASAEFHNITLAIYSKI